MIIIHLFLKKNTWKRSLCAAGFYEKVLQRHPYDTKRREFPKNGKAADLHKLM